jgi:hypothetical protein
MRRMVTEQGRVHGQAVGWDKQTTFTVEALTTEQQFEGTALGDQIVFTTLLLEGDTEVGHQGGVCTVTSVQRNEAQCIATYALRGGQITGQALIILGDPEPYAVAITGGSGKYKGAEGKVRVRPRLRNATERDPDLPPAGLIGPQPADKKVPVRVGPKPGRRSRASATSVCVASRAAGHATRSRSRRARLLRRRARVGRDRPAAGAGRPRRGLVSAGTLELHLGDVRPQADPVMPTM